MASSALAHLRICDFTGQLAGAGATRFLAAFGAQVIRVEDPTNMGGWDIVRGRTPHIDERRGINLGGAFNNHNVEKLGITLNLRTAPGMALVRDLIAVSDVVAENFSAGVMARLGLDYEGLHAINPAIIYVSNCGFGHSGPYVRYKTWGPSVQAVSGLTFSSGAPDLPPAGWGYSYMDHTAGYYMAMAMLMAVYHRNETGAGQWVDLASTEAGATLTGTAILDHSVNGRPLRRAGMPDSTHGRTPLMAPHNVYPCLPGVDRGGADGEAWVAIACRDDEEWTALAAAIGETWAAAEEYRTRAGRLAHEAELDQRIAEWTRLRPPSAVERRLRAAGVPAAAVQTPEQRIDLDENARAWGLWPEAEHTEIGRVRVEGIPVHLSETDWQMRRGAPCLGEHNAFVLGELLGLAPGTIAELHADGVV